MAAQGEPGSGRGNIVRVNIALAVVDVLLLAAVIFLFLVPRAADEPAESGEPSEVTEEHESEAATQEQPAEEAPEAEKPEPEPEPAPSQPEPVDADTREATGRHVVESGDTFYDLAGTYWRDEHLWPDLYVLNRERFPDPDLIRPGDIVRIYPSLASDGELSDSDIEVLSRAYVETYHVYRELGTRAAEEGRTQGSRYLIERSRNRINKAHWLLYSGHRFNRDLAEKYADDIDERDLRVVRRYLERFGYPDP